MALVFGASGVSASLRGQPSFKYGLQAGETVIIPPGTYGVRPGPYSVLQQYNPITTAWENVGGTGTRDYFFVDSDGVNFRVANQSGCLIGAIITNGGTAYVSGSGTTVAVSTGGGKVLPIVGGAINTTVTVTKGGSGYVYPPLVAIAAPPSPGVPATAYCTLSAGAVSTVTVLNQGAGYPVAPAVQFINDPRDTTGSAAQATTALTGAGTITAMIVTDHGNPVTAVPTLTPAGAGSSAAATAIMAFAITSFTVSTAGAGYTAAAGRVMATATPDVTAGTASYTNPDYQVGLVRLRPAIVNMTTSSGGAITTTQSVIDGGVYEAIPGVHSIQIAAGDSIVTTAAILACNVGGLNDSVMIIGC